MTPPPSEAIYIAPRPAMRDRECDFCGRHVQQAISIEHVESAAGASEVVALCPDCALGDD